MNDPIENAFKTIQDTDVPCGPSEELIQATIMSVEEEVAKSTISQPIPYRLLAVGTSAAAVLIVGVTLYAVWESKPLTIHGHSVSLPPGGTSSGGVAIAFVDSDKLEAGQSFLLPLGGPPVRLDPATWPADVLTIKSSNELLQRRSP